MMLPAQVTMIPVFVQFRSLNMVATFWPLILPECALSPLLRLHVFMFRQFFDIFMGLCRGYKALIWEGGSGSMEP